MAAPLAGDSIQLYGTCTEIATWRQSQSSGLPCCLRGSPAATRPGTAIDASRCRGEAADPAEGAAIGQRIPELHLLCRRLQR
jgi:hypothetical protein